MTREDIEQTMSFIAERAMEAEAVGNRDVAGSMRTRWHEMKDRLDALDKATADPFDDASVGLPVRLAYVAPCIESSVEHEGGDVVR
jgi:hypothetical protein